MYAHVGLLFFSLVVGLSCMLTCSSDFVVVLAFNVSFLCNVGFVSVSEVVPV